VQEFLSCKQEYQGLKQLHPVVLQAFQKINKDMINKTPGKDEDEVLELNAKGEELLPQMEDPFIAAQLQEISHVSLVPWKRLSGVIQDIQKEIESFLSEVQLES
jgi:hypothetical protein